MGFIINKNLVFIDSMPFMNVILDTLVKNLSDNDFKYLPQEFSGKLLELVKRKGVNPYDFIDSLKSFLMKSYLRCEIYSSLRDECISEKNYLHANDVWNILERKTMCDYHDLYLKTDLLLLAVKHLLIHAFINYGLDPCHYFNSL